MPTSDYDRYAYRRGDEIMFSDLIMSIRWVKLCWGGEIFPVVDWSPCFCFFLSFSNLFLLAGFSVFSLSLDFDLVGGVFFFDLFWSFVGVDWIRFLTLWDVDLCEEVIFFYLLVNVNLKLTLKTRLFDWINRSTEQELLLF